MLVTFDDISKRKGGISLQPLYRDVRRKAERKMSPKRWYAPIESERMRKTCGTCVKSQQINEKGTTQTTNVLYTPAPAQ
jgi:hypothetical protein